MEGPLLAIPHPFIDCERVDDQRISLPVANLFPVEGGNGTFAMRAPIGGDSADSDSTKEAPQAEYVLRWAGRSVHT
jgi:hypothetical protein